LPLRWTKDGQVIQPGLGNGGTGATTGGALALHGPSGHSSRIEEAIVERLARYRGALLGLAAGDALGTTLEFRSPGSFTPLTDMVGGGPFGLRPGQWTDDTSMALCLAESLVAVGGFDPVDQLRRYVRWYRHGELSSTGTCFDCGNTVRAALHRFEAGSEPYPGSTDPRSAGNGSLMRLAPAPLFYAADPVACLARAADSSRTTHGATAAVDACRYMAGLICGAVRGVPKADLLAPFYTPLPGAWQAQPLCPEIAAIAAGSFTTRQPPEIRGSGYVVAALEAALWAFYRSDDFREGCLLAVNLGDDADTTGAIYGQLAGAYYGEAAIPAAWRAKLAMVDHIVALADQLHALAWPA
jgi:ADP-ribosyl-[dinitrogen reductase] hydrolase